MTRSTRTDKRAQSKEKPRAKRPQVSLAAKRGERQSQFTLQMRESLHRELARKALDSGMTMRGYIMNALKRSGLKVTEADLVDRRRR
jgi:predicted HicB family RNase H-like nuclease